MGGAGVLIGILFVAWWYFGMRRRRKVGLQASKAARQPMNEWSARHTRDYGRAGKRSRYRL